MKRSGVLIFVCALFLGPACADEPRLPNIVYIILDDAGYGDLGCYGQEKFATPNIDRLAGEGMKFRQHYAGSTVCAPTRCVLMTGLHTGRAWVRGNREIQPEGQAPMPADIVTIPRLLSKAGYVTGAFGKWGLGAPGSASDPMEHFDAFFGYNCQRQAHTYYPSHLWKDRERVELDGETYTHPLIMEAGLDFIRANHDRPFFAFFPVTIPHAAMQAPEAYVAPFREIFPQLEKTVGRYAGTEVTNPIAAFAGMMTLLDESVGELLDLLADLDIDEETVVMLTSDNGPHREGGHDPDFFDSNGPLTGYKRDLTEGGIRVPFLVRWPGTVPEGAISDLVSAHWDMLPTFCEMAGVDAPPDIDGISLVPELTGEGEQAKHEFLYWEFYERGGKKAVRWENWKAIQRNINTNPNAPVLLYDLSKDLAEENDLAGSHPELVTRALSFFDEAHVPSELWTFGNN